MKLLFIGYPKCGTCRKAAKWLEEQGLDFTYRHIVENNPKREELAEWLVMSGLPVAKFFNTSGQRYKELHLKDKVKEASTGELLDVLATDGMLVKRPVVVGDTFVLVGFNAGQWTQTFLQNKDQV